MSGVQFFLGSLLKVKPIVQISPEGELQAIEKVRSEKKALQYLVDKVADRSSCRQTQNLSDAWKCHRPGNAFEKLAH